MLGLVGFAKVTIFKLEQMWRIKLFLKLSPAVKLYQIASCEIKNYFIPSIIDMKLHYGDLTDSTCLVKIINEVKPTEIYNLGAQSHVKVKHPHSLCISQSHRSSLSADSQALLLTGHANTHTHARKLFHNDLGFFLSVCEVNK